MKISELIKELEQIKDEYGDLLVCDMDSVLEGYQEEIALQVKFDTEYVKENNGCREYKRGDFLLI